jgi:hypothetical protein
MDSALKDLFTRHDVRLPWCTYTCITCIDRTYIFKNYLKHKLEQGKGEQILIESLLCGR